MSVPHLDDIRRAPVDQPLRLTTATLPQRQRLEIWRDVYCAQLFNMDIAPLGDGPFRADLAMARLGGINLTSGVRTASRAEINRQHVAGQPEMVMLIVLLGGRATASQGKRTAELAAGEAVALRTNQPTELLLPERTPYLGIYVPNTALPATSALDSRIGVTLDRRSEPLALLRSYAQSLWRVGMPSSAAVRQSLSTHLSDLVALNLAADLASAEETPAPSIAAARYAAMRDDISRSIEEPTLSAESLARRHGVSADYVRKLFRQNATSVADVIQAERLDLAFARLTAPGAQNLTIAGIALSVGFEDISYFNRCFRRRFGLAPSDVRRRA